MTKATFKKGAKIERWESNLDDPRVALKQVGVLMVAESQRSFRDQKHGRDKWEPRAPVNVYGIIADFAKGSKPPARRFENSKTLRDTGRLSASIAFRVLGRKAVEVGSNLEYAAVLHHGGKIESETITPEVQKSLGKWLKTKKGVGFKDQLGWLLNKKFTDTKLTGEVPARPFVGITKQTINDVLATVKVAIMEVR